MAKEENIQQILKTDLLSHSHHLMAQKRLKVPTPLVQYDWQCIHIINMNMADICTVSYTEWSYTLLKETLSLHATAMKNHNKRFHSSTASCCHLPNADSSLLLTNWGMGERTRMKKHWMTSPQRWRRLPVHRLTGHYKSVTYLFRKKRHYVRAEG